MFFTKPDLTAGSRPVLLPGEDLLFVQDNVGLYEGKYKIATCQKGHVYLTSHRACYVDDVDARNNSLSVDLKDVEQHEYQAGFLRSSAKVTLQPKVLKHGFGSLRHHVGLGVVSPNVRYSASSPIDRGAWVCTICSFSNPVPSNFDATLANDSFPLAPCLTCGIKPDFSHVLKAAIAADTRRAAPSTPAPPARQPQPSNSAASASAASTNGVGSSGSRTSDVIDCPRCTFGNHPSMRMCEICGAPLPVYGKAAEGVVGKLQRAVSPGPEIARLELDDNVPNESIKFSFRGGGDKVFYEKLKNAVIQRKWLVHNAPPIPRAEAGDSTPGRGGATPTKPAQSMSVGIAGLEERGLLARRNDQAVLGSAFEDLEALMASAKDIVALAERFAAEAGHGKSDGALSEGATALGMMATKDRVGDGSNTLYINELSRTLAEYVTEEKRGILRANGGIVGLIDLWAMVNRARNGVELISPADFHLAAEAWARLNLPLRLRAFRSGLLVVQGSDWTEEKSVITAQEAALQFGWSVGVASEELEMAEEKGALCREEGIEGLKFWLNYLGEEGEGIAVLPLLAMARLGRAGFLALAVIFHLVYIYSIFDIYFVSPIVHGMQAHRAERQQSPPAKRLVLFVGDGLRADKAFQSFPDPDRPTNNNSSSSSSSSDDDSNKPRPLAPFLRSRVLDHGTFGVSHTRVPTESRPGHVALIAGLYEDVSAVATGWTENPVEFDSVFNRSRHTWSWGSPDILPMFKHGAVPGRVDADQYGAEFEDFSKDATALDKWVFDRVKALFHDAATNASLAAALRQDQTVFFLHLLGLDTTGHAYRPYSNEYLHNIKVVDRGVAEITSLIDAFYADNATAYVFTADHGMSDWGSHGDGNPDNTRTPLVVWGAGVAPPAKFAPGRAPGHDDGFSHDWGLDHIQRHDVAQADVAALMAYLAGLEFPVNSVGELPLSYLAASEQDKAAAALANAKQVLEIYKVKEAQKQANALRFRPCPLFSAANASVADRIAEIESSMGQHDHGRAIDLSQRLLKDGLQGLRYLQTYDWLFLRVLITIGYLGWIAYATTTVIDLHLLRGSTPASRTLTSSIFFSSILVLLYASFVVEKSPLTYYAYAFFPLFFWEDVFAHRRGFVAAARLLFADLDRPSAYLSLALQALVYLAVLEGLVQSYFHRIIFTLCYGLAAFWPNLYGSDFIKNNSSTALAWAAGCLTLSTFTLLPVVKVENANTISLGGLLMLAAGLVFLLFEHHIIARSRTANSLSRSSPLSRTLIGLQIGLILLTIIVTRSSVASLQAKTGLPLGNQVVGWLALVSSVTLPFLHRLAPNNHYLHRLVIIFLAFSPCFILLTISYEGLFYTAFSGTLLTWVRLEQAIFRHHTRLSTPTTSRSSTNLNGSISSTATATATSHSRGTGPRHPTTHNHHHRALTLPDLRTALFFLFLLQSAFFSTGNIASISTFSLDAVYRLIPIFDPFSQGALLLFKIMVPFALISAALGILNRRLGLQSSALFMVVMTISDVMTLNFFWMVKDEGSWLDIGTTISHFVIASLIGVFVAGLEVISELMIQGVQVDQQVDVALLSAAASPFLVDSRHQLKKKRAAPAANLAPNSHGRQADRLIID
ncbi:hypothetical protein DV737_g3071, partial [Chaetothyriales sp. CBS 132003]